MYIWGFNNAECLERLHRKFLKRLLNVKMSTCNAAVYVETGRFPLHVNWKMRIVKYWLKIVKSENCILENIYKKLLFDCENGEKNWLYNVKMLLTQIGLAEVWLFPTSVNMNVFLHVLKTRLIDNFITECRIRMDNSPSLTLFRELKEGLELSVYLMKINNFKHRQIISKIRMSSHCLNIEYGRHRNIERQNRLCELCDKLTIEDEFHFVLECNIFKDIRMKFIPKYYRQRPSMMKFVELMKTENKRLLHNIALYLLKAFNKRQERVT